MSMELSGPACCVELNVRVFADQYLASLLIDGMIEQRLVLQTEREVTDWANTMLCTSGRDLYIHLQVEGTGLMWGALELARKFCRQDLMIGIAGQGTICRIPGQRLQ